MAALVTTVTADRDDAVDALLATPMKLVAVRLTTPGDFQHRGVS
ncbi:hypothetical protein ACQP1G_27855 [Nocardia sp. CA-107356]